MATSVRTTTSISYMNEYVDSLVVDFTVVQCAHNNPSNSSTHLSLAVSNLFFKLLIISLLVDSTCPLFCGYLGVENSIGSSNNRKIPELITNELGTIVSYNLLCNPELACEYPHIPFIYISIHISYNPFRVIVYES